jgi:hypothetical protein
MMSNVRAIGQNPIGNREGWHDLCIGSIGNERESRDGRTNS